MILGDKKRLGFEIDPAVDGSSLRRVAIWSDGILVTVQDDMAYVPQFVESLCKSSRALRRLHDASRFPQVRAAPDAVEAVRWIEGTRDPDAPQYDAYQDQAWPEYRFMDWGPTTDEVLAFLVRTGDRATLVWWPCAGALRDAADRWDPHVVTLSLDELEKLLQEGIDALSE